MAPITKLIGTFASLTLALLSTSAWAQVPGINSGAFWSPPAPIVNTVATANCGGAGCVGGTSARYLNASGNIPGASFTDEDDTQGLQAAITDIFSNYNGVGTVTILPPTRPSGYYNICSTLSTPSKLFIKFVLEGSLAPIRVGGSAVCPTYNLSSLTFNNSSTMLYIPYSNTGGSGYHVHDTDQIIVRNLYLDGNNIAQSEIFNSGSIEIYENITLRNSLGGAYNTSTNFFGEGGGDVSFSGRNRMGNYNDSWAPTVYYGQGTYPAYNFLNYWSPSHTAGMHDSTICCIAPLNATIANVWDASGSGMIYLGGMQAYGDKSGADQYGAPCYNWALTDTTTELKDSYAGGTQEVSACVGVVGTPPSAGIFILRDTNVNTATANHAIQVSGGFAGVNPPAYGFLAEYGAHYTLDHYDFQPNFTVSCFGQYDTNGVIQTTPIPSAFANITQVGSLINCPFAIGTQPQSVGDLFVQTDIIQNGRKFDNGIVDYQGTTAPVTGSVITAGAEPGADVTLTAGLASLTVKLPFPNPTYSHQKYSLDFWGGVITTLSMEDSSGGTSDLQGMPTTVAGTGGCHYEFEYVTVLSKWRTYIKSGAGC